MNRIRDFYSSADRGGRILLLIAILFLPVCCVSTLLFSPDDESASRPTLEAITERIVQVSTDVPMEEPTATTEPQDTFTPQPTYTPLPTYTPPPTQTPLPTYTPPPTQTSPPPTAIPSTSTPQPTSTTESNSEAEAEGFYTSQMVEIADLYTKSLQGLATQSDAAGENISLMFDDDWKIMTAVYLAGLTVANESLRELDPPDRFRDVHADMLEAADYFDLVVKNYAEGVDELNADKLNMAATNMQLGTEAVNRATDKLAMIDMP